MMRGPGQRESPERIRILMTTDVAGGVWSYTAELADALAAQGHMVALAAFGGLPDLSQRAWLTVRPDLDFTPIPCPLEWMPEPEPGLSASIAALRQAVARVSPDVVHLNQFFYGALELGAPKLVVAHSDVVSWWRAVKEAEPPDDAWFGRYRGWVRNGLAGADIRVAPSAWLAGEVETIYGEAPVRALHNGRSHDWFPAPHEERPRERRVITAGRLWDEGKGAHDLIEAAERLGSTVEVAVAGPIAHPAGGMDFPAHAPGIEWVGILGAAELRQVIGRARVYAATSRYEPFGLAPLEAALAGCALVVTDIPTFRELWDGCALFYAPGDTAALARAVGELMEDDERWHRLARAARARALWRYTPERMAHGYAALYRELLS